MPGSLLITLRKDSLVKAVGSGDHPVRINEHCSTEMNSPVLQAGLPWPLAFHGILAPQDLPHHPGLPAHCGDKPNITCEQGLPFWQSLFQFS